MKLETLIAAAQERSAREEAQRLARLAERQAQDEARLARRVEEVLGECLQPGEREALAPALVCGTPLTFRCTHAFGLVEAEQRVAEWRITSKASPACGGLSQIALYAYGDLGHGLLLGLGWLLSCEQDLRDRSTRKAPPARRAAEVAS